MPKIAVCNNKKICTKCSKEKDISEFRLRVSYYESSCKECEVKYKNNYNSSKLGKEVRKSYLERSDKKIKEVRNTYRREKYKNDPGYNIEHRFRTRLQKLTRTLNSKQCSTISYLGCSRQEFKQHIENQFFEGMSWENKERWDIDHITPCCSFDLTLQEDLKKCFHYSNLRPLWKIENSLKIKEDLQRKLKTKKK